MPTYESLRRGPPPVTRQKIAAVRARLSTPATTFHHLLLDPFTLNDCNWGLQSPQIHAVVKELEFLECAGTFQIQPDPSYRPDETLNAMFDDCVRTLWPTLMLWLDYLYPMHHKGTRRLGHVPLRILALVIYTLVSRQGPVATLCAETPQLYRLLFYLWLRFDQYYTRRTNFGICMDAIACAVTNAMGERAFIEERDRFGSIDRAPLSVSPPDPFCVAGVLVAVRNRPRQAYRRALQHAHKLLAIATGTNSDDAFVSINAFQTHMAAFARLAQTVLPVTKHRRETIRSLVRLMRTLCDHRCGGPSKSIGVVMVLYAIWRSCEDGRSIAWALREDALAGLFWVVNGDIEEAKLEFAYAAIRFVAENTYRLCVLRALCPKGTHLLTFISGKFASPAVLSAIDAWIKERELVRRASYYKACALPECRAQHAKKLRRCACLDAFYCSKDCQRSHRPLHKDVCAGSDASHLGYLRRFSSSKLNTLFPEDAHFISVCGRHYLNMHARAILRSVERLQENAPPTERPPTISILINISRLFCDYRVFLDEDSWPEDQEDHPSQPTQPSILEDRLAGGADTFTSLLKKPGYEGLIHRTESTFIRDESLVLVLAEVTCGTSVRVYHVKAMPLRLLKEFAQSEDYINYYNPPHSPEYIQRAV
ncbi:uncharacterized protein SCHCODRAFT_02644619 [Schizophyllum commune H4-8]|nr:uncharacterized protein SCHCODRAFT_02644619 [Schizophyllum commune H4-8]KAI5885390.1 hypothetical protein SCHCODRAFT_02644619 [Schizophyllum commune H4-8]